MGHDELAKEIVEDMLADCVYLQRDGEAVAEYVNRMRPLGAPRVSGPPAWGTAGCWVWNHDDESTWIVEAFVSDQDDRIVTRVIWGPTQSVCDILNVPIFWYELNPANGNRYMMGLNWELSDSS